MTRPPHCNLIDLSCCKCCSTVKIQAARTSDHATNANANSFQASEWSVLRLLIAGRARYSPIIRIHLKKALVVFNNSYELVSFCTVGLSRKPARGASHSETGSSGTATGVDCSSSFVRTGVVGRGSSCWRAKEGE